MIRQFSRNILYHRHRLTHQQIDDILGENQSQKYPEAKAQHLMKLAEFDALAKLFSDGSIGFIPLKGPVLSYRIYNDPLYRNYSDLDFLLEENNIEKAISLLINRGYSFTSTSFPEDKCRKKILLNYTNQICLYNQNTDVTVELHWKLFKYSFTEKRALESIIKSNTINLEFNGNTITVLNNELELLYNIIHGGLHRWSDLKWLVDIKDFLKVSFEKGKLQLLINELHAGRMVAICNELLNYYFPDSKNFQSYEPISGNLTGYCKKSISDDGIKKGTIRESINVFRYQSNLSPVLRYKISVFRFRLFAYDLVYVKWLPCSLYVYYILSPFWKFGRDFKRLLKGMF